MWSDDSDDDGSADDTRAAAASAPADDGLSAYERQRQENIDKNKKVLASLGLLGESTPGGLIERRVSNGPAVPREKKDYGARSLPGRSTRAPPERLSMTKLGGTLGGAGRRGSSDAERAQQGASSSSDALMMLPPPPSAPFIPNCPECSGPAKRMKYETRRFVCLDPTCAHEVIWARRREIISCHAHTRAHTLYAQMQAPPCSLSHSLSLSLATFCSETALPNVLHAHACNVHARDACTQTAASCGSLRHLVPSSRLRPPQWNVVLCGLCGQPKKGHTCPGIPKPPPPPPLPPKESESEPLTRLAKACLMHDEVLHELSARRPQSTTKEEFIVAARRAARCIAACELPATYLSGAVWLDDLPCLPMLRVPNDSPASRFHPPAPGACICRYVSMRMSLA